LGWIETRRGKIKQRARLTDKIHPKVVGAQYGWWFPEKAPTEYGFRDSNVNMLLGGGPYDPPRVANPYAEYYARFTKCNKFLKVSLK